MRHMHLFPCSHPMVETVCAVKLIRMINMIHTIIVIVDHSMSQELNFDNFFLHFVKNFLILYSPAKRLVSCTDEINHLAVII